MSSVLNHRVDVQIENNGSIILLRPMTPEGDTWLRDNCAAEGWQWFGGALAIEPRFAGQVVTGLKDDGLIVK